MPDPKHCPACSCELPADSPSGLCPTCLLGQGMSHAAAPGQPAPRDLRLQATSPPGAAFVPPKPNDLSPHFPHLEVLDLIGHGGMGAVYKARQTKLDRVVALKIIRLESASDPAFTERFNREARTLARLSHPNIVGVYDFGEFQLRSADAPGESLPVVYFLMEYVDGANLRELIETKELRPEQALAIVPQICEALEFAHDHGVIHRDIKPENILMDRQGRVRIADFGLAKLVSGTDEDFTLTGTHQVMGTPRYMAPEQMDGAREVDHRADIYSLGVVFYEMLTGEIPAGHFEPPSRKVQVDVRLDEIVLRSMAREPERRYQRATDISTQVAMLGAGSPILPPKPEARPAARWSLPWREFALSQLLLIPFLGLLAFVMATTGSAWPLCGLALPWVLIPIATLHLDEKPAEGAVTATAVVCLLGSLAIIAYGVVIAGSATPLFAILVCLGAAILGAVIGTVSADDEEEESNELDEAGAGTAAKDDDDDDDEDDEDDEDEEGSPTSNIESVATWMFFVSIFVCFVSADEYGRILSVLNGESGGDWALLRLICAPLVLLGSVTMSSHRSLPLAVATGIMCLPLGLVFDNLFFVVAPFLLGIWSLYTFSRPENWEYFRQPQPDAGEETGGKPPKVVADRLNTGWPNVVAWLLVAAAVVVAALSVPGLRHRLIGMSESERTARGQADLFEAATRGDAEEVRLLLKNDFIQVDDRNSDGDTAMMLAAQHGRASLVVELLARGADPDSQNEAGMSALMLAVKHEQEKVLSVLAGIPAAIQATMHVLNEDQVHLSVDYNAQNKQGETALMLAAKSGSAEMIALLHGADAAIQDSKGRNALMHAVAHEQLDLLRQLVKQHTNSLVRHVSVNGVEDPMVPDHWYHPMFAPRVIGAVNQDGKTALQLARDAGEDEIAALIAAEAQRAIDNLTAAIDANGPQKDLFVEAQSHARKALD